MSDIQGWSVCIKDWGGERKVAVEAGDKTLWLDADHARQLAAALEGKADELEGKRPR
jgi:hypothetical protein